MKRILTIVFILIAFASSAQTPVYRYLTTQGETGRVRGNVVIDGIIWIAEDTVAVPVALWNKPGIAGKGDSLYRWSPVQHKYIFIGAGGASVWGSVTGSLANQTDLMAALNGKQNKLLQGTTGQYFRGDLSLSTFSTDVQTVVNGLYSPLAHTHQSLTPQGGQKGYVLRKLSATDYDYTWQPIETISPVSSVFGRVGAVTAQASDYSAYYPSLTRFYDSVNALRAYINSVGIYFSDDFTTTFAGPNDTVALNHVKHAQTYATNERLADSTAELRELLAAVTASLKAKPYDTIFQGQSTGQFLLPKTPVAKSEIEVHINGKYLPQSSYSLTVNTILIYSSALAQPLDFKDRVFVKWRSFF